MKIRRTVSLTTFISFIFLAYTGITLFLCPQGRVAYWGGWKLFGLSKEQYGAVHSTFMVLFLAAGIWHTVLNWKPIVNYLRNKAKQVRVFTPEFNLSLVLCLVFFVGTLAGWFPFAQFLGLGEQIKTHWEKTVGSPPWGHAEESTLKRFSRGMEDYLRMETNERITIDPNDAVEELRKEGYVVTDADQKLIEIARSNSTTPQVLSDVIVRAARPVEGTPVVQPNEPFPTPASGLGRMTLEEYAAKYRLNLESMVETLKAGGMEIDPNTKLKDEAARLGTDPHALIEFLNASAEDG
jgi:hypothetical protein